MDRPIHHHAYVSRSFKRLCEALDQQGPELVQAATRHAGTFAADLAGYLESRLGFFDQDERIQVELGPLKREEHGATATVEWHADGTKRLLPNVKASLHLTPIISSGKGATSELTLSGTYTPPRARHAGLIEHALARRVVDATLHTFLRHLAEDLESA